MVALTAESSPHAIILHLDAIFAREPCIDEVGIVHPSQVSSLRPCVGSCTVADDAKAAAATTGTSNTTALPDAPGAGAHPPPPPAAAAAAACDQGSASAAVGEYDDLVFYCGDRKLAIALPAVRSLYGAAAAMFAAARRQYRALLLGPRDNAAAAAAAAAVRTSGGAEATAAAGTDDDRQQQQQQQQQQQRVPEEEEDLGAVKAALEDRILSSSRALVLVNCDHASAWNARKRVLANREMNQGAVDAELLLATAVLSCGPKSEEAWAHRRWVINSWYPAPLERTTMNSFLATESLFVEHIAERSRMNYRAWRHRCWLVSLMSLSQVIAELTKTKPWAQSHVSDNCCFHYRRCLLLRMLELSASNPSSCHGGLSERVGAMALEPCDSATQLAAVCEEEVSWNMQLLELYIGHEAVWIHRRFLFGLWLTQSNDVGQSNDHNLLKVKRCPVAPAWSMSTRSELMMADACIALCKSATPDAMLHKELAASYKLWVLALGCKNSSPLQNGGTSETPAHSRSMVISSLMEESAHRCRLWNGLVSNIL